MPLHRRPRPVPTDSGQATVEYALVLLAAAAIAVLVITWATTTGRVGELFDRVFDMVVDDVPTAS